jgi:hypothetical protein
MFLIYDSTSGEILKFSSNSLSLKPHERQLRYSGSIHRPVKVDLETLTVVDKELGPPSQHQINHEWISVRAKRDKLLFDCDWLVVKQAETGKAIDSNWLYYREALRDITKQEDPFNITWPVKP